MYILSRLVLAVVAGAAILLAKKAIRQQEACEPMDVARQLAAGHPRPCPATAAWVPARPAGSTRVLPPYPRWFYLATYLQGGPALHAAGYCRLPAGFRTLGPASTPQPL